MSLAKELFQLQQLEQEIEAKKGELAKVIKALEKSQEVDEAQNALKQSKEWLDKLKKDQREKEWLLEDLQTRTKDLEKKLYAGKDKGHKELESLRKEVEKLQNRRNREEELIFELMAESEDGQKNLERFSERLKKAEEHWDREKSGLSLQSGELEEALKLLEQKKSNQLSRLTAEDLESYNKLKVQKQGKAIARVEQGRCQGCQLNLSLNFLQRLKTESGLIHCDNCGRILLLE